MSFFICLFFDKTLDIVFLNNPAKPLVYPVTHLFDLALQKFDE
jgi:hypothetical protein